MLVSVLQFWWYWPFDHTPIVYHNIPEIKNFNVKAISWKTHKWLFVIIARANSQPLDNTYLIIIQKKIQSNSFTYACLYSTDQSQNKFFLVILISYSR